MRLRSLVLCLPIPCVLSQTPDLQMNAVYVCTDGQSFKVFSCNAANGACDFQNYKNGQAFQRGEALRVQLVALLNKCHAQTPAEAQADPHRGEIPPAPSPFAGRTGAAPANARPGNAAPAAPTAVAGAAASGSGGGGFKVGDHVRVLASGWQDATVLQVRGNSYFVRLDNGIEVSKGWPIEVRRQGKLTAADHAAGQWDLRERVQVQVNGRWAEGIIVAQNYNRYRVQFPDLNTVEAGSENLRSSAAQPPAAARPAGQPPKPGLVSCAGKYEGRWEHVSGGAGMTAVFRSGKATITEGLGGPMEFECWMTNGQLSFFKAGSSTPFSYGFEVNNDGTLQTPLGAIKKKGN